MSIYQFCIYTQNNTNITHYLELSPIIEKIGVRIEGIDKGNLVGGVEEAALGLTNGQIAAVLLLAFRWRSLLWKLDFFKEKKVHGVQLGGKGGSSPPLKIWSI